MISATVKGHLFALVTITIWSSTFIVSKILLASMTPLQILTIRFAIAIVFLSIIHPRFRRPVSIREELLFLGIGAALVFYFICENSALKQTFTSNVSLIVATIPLLTGVLSMAFNKTRFLTRKRIIGFILAYLGVTLIIISGNRLQGVKPIGDLLALSAAVLFAFYSLLMEKTPKDRHLIQLTRKVFVYGFFILAAVSLISWEPVLPLSVTPSMILSLLFLGIVASSLAFILWNHAIKAIGSVKTNQYIYLIPVVTTLMSAVMLSEPITVTTVIGAVLILSGLYLSEKTNGACHPSEDQPVRDAKISTDDSE
ncbi:MAG: DMT family transporter [Bacillota bacterium]|nr:DMT family transporter [Bacillota bacterium]